MNPGEGNIDFPAVFTLLETSGYSGFYTMAFGSLDDKLTAGEYFATCARLGRQPTQPG